MSIVKDKLFEYNFTLEEIAIKLGVNVKTLNNWFRYKHVDFMFKYLKLIIMLDIDIINLINEYEEYKKKEV